MAWGHGGGQEWPGDVEAVRNGLGMPYEVNMLSSTAILCVKLVKTLK